MRVFKQLLVLIVVLGHQLSSAQTPIEEFVESFNGTGGYFTVDSQYSGLDNPGWYIAGREIEQRESGFHIALSPGGNEFSKELAGRASFVERIELRNVDMSPLEPMEHHSRNIALSHYLHPNDGRRDHRLMIWLVPTDISPDIWGLGMNSGGIMTFDAVPPGSHISLEIRYDDVRSQASFSYDNDLDDATPATSYGPFDYAGLKTDKTFTNLFAFSGGTGSLSATVDSWSYRWDPGDLGDFNQDGVLDVADIDALTIEVGSGTNNALYDLNADQRVDDLDRTFWVKTLRRTYFGDSNLDGEFSSLDLVQVFQGAQFEDDVVANSTWSTGDWDGDAEFSSRDVVMAFSDGGYEQGPKATAHSVPEPCIYGVYVLIVAAHLFHRSQNYGQTEWRLIGRKS